MRKLYQASTHFFLPNKGTSAQPQVKLLRFDCIESPFSWEAMTAFDVSTITLILNRPSSPSDQIPTTLARDPTRASQGDLLGHSATEDDEIYAELE